MDLHEKIEQRARDFKMKEDSLTISTIKKRILGIELAIQYTKKTTRIKQNEKLLHGKQQELQNAIYQHNKFDVFNLMSDFMDAKLTQALHARMNWLSENLAEVK